MPYRIITQRYKDAGTCVVQDDFDMYEDARQAQRQVYGDSDDTLYDIEYYTDEKESTLWTKVLLFTVPITSIVVYFLIT